MATPLKVSFREPYQKIYEAFCFRPGLAQTPEGQVLHQTFNAMFRDTIRGWIQSRTIPSRDQVAIRCEHLLEEARKSLSIGADLRVEREHVDAERIDAAIRMAEISHHGHWQEGPEGEGGVQYLVWKALIQKGDLSYPDIDFLRTHFAGGLDYESMTYHFPAGRIALGPRTRARSSMPSALYRYDQLVLRRVRAVVSRHLVEDGHAEAPIYTQSRLARWWHDQALSRLCQ